MTNQDTQLLADIDQMIEQAPEIGICPLPFKLLRERVEVLVAQKNWLMSHRMSGVSLPADDVLMEAR